MTTQPDELQTANKNTIIQMYRALEKELASLTASLAEADEAIVSLRTTMTTDPRDWSLGSNDAWLYGIVVGWGDALDEIAEKHHWGNVSIDKLKKLSIVLTSTERQKGRGKI